ncbi:hypothetical protein BZL41_11070 [Pseudomonas sp. PIC25]|uniref:SMI1/KNR4 family protein n=1 Tax=Pseudomonas sp. PIC25 TaxID=1958773 RepID=UPI000BABB9D7|nr:SMI1/KNR4 family protein [Pseudomonas sp. PIC25]PAU63976.1 hypothetical protein BZL41_11070 [Pseudomonas sp. PIC25]
MKDINEILASAKASSEETFWNGPVPISEVEKLEELLGCRLPNDFRCFLEASGGGGFIDSEISGIEDGDAANSNGGTVYGDTLRCREEYGLPVNGVVIFFRDEEICWCLCKEQDAWVVRSYSLHKRKYEKILYSSFTDFFDEYVELRR